MTVYVDDYFAPYGRMKMCHMVADTHEELVKMVNDIGLSTKWIQKAGTPQEHFDLSMAYRQRAIRHGAKPVTYKQLGAIIRMKRCP